MEVFKRSVLFGAATALFLCLGAPALAGPSPSPSPSPSPTPAAAAPLREIGHVIAGGRKENLVGKALAASEGSISQEQIATRPILRPGEVLEAIPGLVITQHSGEGKANQYYLRGFQLDHGTDLEGTIVGVPINLPTHAHGQGYSDINWLIPELVSYVEFKKGPYYADQGDFSTAGSYNLFYRNTIAPTTEIGLGEYGYNRFFAANSPKLGDGRLLYAVELYHDNGSLDRPDEYQKLNGVLRYSRTSKESDFAVTGMAYSGTFDSTDQIPQRLIEQGVIDRYGYIDASDGGNTYRYALSSAWNHRDPNGATHLNLFGFQQFLDLYSNFTYFLDDATDYYNVTSNPVTCSAVYTTCTPGPVHTDAYASYCPANDTPAGGSSLPHSVTPAPFAFACGDQREQVDKRFVTGFSASRSFEGRDAITTVGVGLRNDNIAQVGLFLTHARVRYPNGTLSDDRAVERSTNAWVQTEVRVGSKLRLTGGLRGDLYTFHVHAFNPANSGSAVQGILSPKFLAAYAASPHQEFYLDFGDSFHSNDGRGITERLDPQTNAPFDPAGAPVQQVSPLVRAVGEEVGYRYAAPRFNTTISLWQLNLASELIFDGDHGTTFAGRPTVRRGIEIANFYTPTKSLTIDGDFATSTAKFLTDPDHIGTGVPESLNAVVSIGATIDRPTYDTSLRVRYFGPRTLIENGSANSQPSTILNGQYTRKLARGARLTLEALNILNAQVDDVEYYYGSWLPQDAANPLYASNPAVNPVLGGGGVNDYHLHPAEKRIFRLVFSTGF